MKSQLHMTTLCPSQSGVKRTAQFQEIQFFLLEIHSGILMRPHINRLVSRDLTPAVEHPFYKQVHDNWTAKSAFPSDA